ncbi:T9SS type B sorting domain-containing protein [Gaetbulibacter saemankumensis]|uniref:T9SS type B sorting domain-containing protein n=1 Tax=Gaetbulibacter saemankumensis TaxID=311208 RepID=UPI000685891F|nr:T9SS type B sorting domain-containing protein [Gaetbulibacter saemankumensis]
MALINSLKRLFIIGILLFWFNGHSQLSKTHYIPPLTESGDNSSIPQDQYIYISTPSNTTVTFTIKPIGQSTNSYISGTVSNTIPYEYNIGSSRDTQLFVNANETSTIKTNKGFIIEAEAPIYVSVRINAGAQAGALVSKGLSALGTTFRVGSYTNENPQTNYLNFVSVMATEADTKVTFSDLPTGLIIQNYTGPTPIDITLNAGESYIIATNSTDAIVNRDGLIGALVQSDKPIVVNCGSANGSFHNGNGRDYGIDQIADYSKVGTEYIFVKGDGSNSWENILIVAHTDNTTISINGNASTVTINAGEYYLIEGNMYNASGNMYVETNNPVFTYQGVGATTSEANQGMFFVPPLSCEAKGNLNNITQIEKIGNTSYSGGVSIVTKVGATITINNTPLSNFTSFGPNTVTGNPDYVTYKILDLIGNISVESNDELYCAYFNYNGAATSGSFYSGFPTSPEIIFDPEFATLGNCIPNITLSAANTDVFDSFQWWYDDGLGGGFVNTNASTPDFTPLVPGKYKLIGYIACSGLTLESVEVPVSICPDDIDNDGIIDNIDIDNDNDGILNCTESRGDVIINLSDPMNPEFNFQDGTINSTMANTSFSQNNSSGLNNNTFTGATLGDASLGDFTSTVEADNNAESQYTMDFTEPVNIILSENNITHTIIDGEHFIVKILPTNKNITLIDPDNRLLIDSNFDGDYESGVTQISSTEIHFKINPNPNGNTPYKFVANQVESFTFSHHLSNANDTSSFSANLALTCFNLDTDGDGIHDSLDLDSDNDGIPDIIEAQGIVQTISNIDSNNDGLDDIFNNTVPIDSDSDGVYDFYDLDSDNDGIYDLEESGSGLPDSNQDGIIDNVLATIGVNGWDDNAESASDSNDLGYTVSDTDSDNLLNYIDSDSDGDTCNDVIEAGFSDGNADNQLGDNPSTVNTFGIVNNAAGYITPDPNYLINGSISISVQPINTTVCENASTTIFVDSPEADAFQWELSTDGTNWTPINNNAVYGGTQTSTLTISTVPINYNNNLYRVKLDRTGNTCGLYSDEITLFVNPVPIVNPTVELIQCDDDDPSTFGYSAFNLTEANNKISTNATNLSFSYYLSQNAAIAGDQTSPDYIDSPTAYKNKTINTDYVWARAENNSGCASVSQITLKVSTTTIPSSFLRSFNQCDDFLDINGDDTINNDNRDGVASFDFSSAKSDIENLFIPQTPTVTFYRNEMDALAEQNVITNISNYRNIGYPESQYIYVRVDSEISNDCLGLGPHILLTVEALPVAYSVIINRECDDDQDGQFPFDTSNVETDLLGNQNPADFTITYTDEAGNSLPSPLPNPFLTSSQTLSIRIENNNTNAPDGPCYDETTLEFIVDESPIANPITPITVCDGDAGDIDDDGLYPFETSSFTTTILGSQTNMEIFYTFITESGNTERVSSLPNPFNSGTQSILVEIINPLNTNCSASTTIDLTVNPLPEFTIETPQIVCSSDPTFTIVLDPEETNTNENFTYVWTYEDGTKLGTTPTLTVSQPGTYFITLTKTDGSNCSRTKEVYVNASELATITQNDITIEDISSNNKIIINENNLGLGDYEYALDSEFSFQDDPYFENVKAGFHTLYVRDKRGCGTSSIIVSVVGYPKYFTPNNDGQNDYWQLLGVNAQFQPSTTIYIFDRYGKLVKELSPKSQGWDGTSRGYPMPTDDYWFSVILQDGREFKGHFTLKR